MKKFGSVSKNFHRIILVLVLGIGIFSLATPTSYALYDPVKGDPGREGVIRASSPKELASNILCPIISAMFAVLMVISSIMVLYGAYLYLTAAGDTEKVSKGTKTITYAAVAIVVALVAKNFPIIIATFFGTTLGAGCA